MCDRCLCAASIHWMFSSVVRTHSCSEVSKSPVVSGPFSVSVTICNTNRRKPLPRTLLGIIELFDPFVSNSLVTGSGFAQLALSTCATCDTSDGISPQVIIEEAKSGKVRWHLWAVRILLPHSQKHVSEMPRSWSRRSLEDVHCYNRLQCLGLCASIRVDACTVYHV